MYVWTLAGFCYVALLTDVYSRRILGWRVTTSKTTPLVLSVLEQALFTRRRADAQFTGAGVVHHSDAGSQYTSIAFTDALVEAGLAGSIGSVGDALDNALAETAIGLYKTECVREGSPFRRGPLATLADLEHATSSWVHWYNTERLMHRLGRVPLAEARPTTTLPTSRPTGPDTRRRCSRNPGRFRWTRDREYARHTPPDGVKQPLCAQRR